MGTAATREYWWWRVKHQWRGCGWEVAWGWWLEGESRAKGAVHECKGWSACFQANQHWFLTSSHITSGTWSHLPNIQACLNCVTITHTGTMLILQSETPLHVKMVCPWSESCLQLCFQSIPLTSYLGAHCMVHTPFTIQCTMCNEPHNKCSTTHNACSTQHNQATWGTLYTFIMVYYWCMTCVNVHASLCTSI